MERIPRQRLEAMFDRCRSLLRDGRTRWDIDSECRWSYFFKHEVRETLLDACVPLQDEGFEFQGTLDPDETDEAPVYFIRFDRIETHTVDSLGRVNERLYAFAGAQGIEYDGMDVGAVDGP